MNFNIISKMFKATISDTRSWRNSIEAIAALIDEGTLQIEKDGLKLRAMDPSQIALVDLELPASAFDKYEVEEPTSIGIDFSELSKITKRSRAEDKIELSLEENRLKMVFMGETNRRFNLGIIESTSSPPREPSVDFTSEIKIGANILKEALKDAELISNHVAILANDGFSITAQGDTGSAEIKFPAENIMGLSVKEKSRSVFALDQLNNLLKASDQTSIIILKLKTDAPLRLEYAIGDGRVVYYLAPRIEST
ncbi:MAG: proliferating cell nuclear antigen (pcna) [Candidatus Altiarchaeales archaeon]|nr:MAG: proliferating cell nuclear antigen (pcna) [Candidatus Altiarchaeales archaeon]